MLRSWQAGETQLWMVSCSEGKWRRRTLGAKRPLDRWTSGSNGNDHWKSISKVHGSQVYLSTPVRNTSRLSTFDICKSDIEILSPWERSEISWDSSRSNKDRTWPFCPSKWSWTDTSNSSHSTVHSAQFKHRTTNEWPRQIAWTQKPPFESLKTAALDPGS